MLVNACFLRYTKYTISLIPYKDIPVKSCMCRIRFVFLQCKMPPLVPLSTLLLVSHDEVVKVVVKSMENSQFETGWKAFSLAKESYFEGFYVHITSSGISFNGLKLAYVVDNKRVFLETNSASITFVSDLDKASAFHILRESTDKDGVRCGGGYWAKVRDPCSEDVQTILQVVTVCVCVCVCVCVWCACVWCVCACVCMCVCRWV